MGVGYQHTILPERVFTTPVASSVAVDEWMVEIAVVVVDVLSQHYGLARTVPPYTYRGHKPVKRSVGQSNVLRQSGGRVHFKNQIEVNFSRRKSSEGVEALVK